MAVKGIESFIEGSAWHANIRSSWDDMKVKFTIHRQMLGATVFCFYQAILLLSCDTEGYKPWEIKLSTGKGFFSPLPLFKGRCRNSSHLSLQQDLLLKAFNNCDELIKLVGESGVKSLFISILPEHDKLKLTLNLHPVAGNIAVIFFPPVPPFVVNLKSKEIESHFRIIEILGDHIKSHFLAEIDKRGV